MTKFESSEAHYPRKSVLDIKEGEPRVHTVYAYITEQQKERSGATDKVFAIYTEREGALKSAHMDSMATEEGDRIIPLKVYERLEDLPEAIRSEIHGEGVSLPVEVAEGGAGTVYAVMPNTDSTEGRGFLYIWTLTTDAELARQIARKNGPSGSNAKVITIPLNRQLEVEDLVFSGINIRR